MSASSPSLKHPAVIGFLILGAVVVTILNVKTFAPGNKRPSRRVQAAVLDQPALPPDLALLVQEAMNASQGQAVNSGDQHRELPTLARDPFKELAYSRKITPVEVKEAAKKAPTYACSAVMTGGRRPSAMINGKFYSPGDKVGPWTLAWIASNGVTLESHGGYKKFLPLANKSTQRGSLQVSVGNK